MFVFIIVGFAAAVLMGTDALASFEADIYNALGDAFDFLPIIAIVGAFAYVKGKN